MAEGALLTRLLSCRFGRPSFAAAACRVGRLRCYAFLLGGVCGLVATPVFKTGVSSDPAQAGSIPVRLRYQRVCLLGLRSAVEGCLPSGTVSGTVLA
jgi:hypothetical protein